MTLCAGIYRSTQISKVITFGGNNNNLLGTESAVCEIIINSSGASKQQAEAWDLVIVHAFRCVIMNFYTKRIQR